MKAHETAPVSEDAGFPAHASSHGGAAGRHGGGPAPEQGRSAARFAFDSVQVFGGQIAMMAVGVVNGIIMARWLGASGRGTLQILMLMPLVLSNFVKLGIPQASVYYMRRRGASASDVASNSVWIAFVTGGLAVGVCWIWRDWLLARFLKAAPPGLLLPSLCLIPFMLLQFYLLGVAQAQQRFREYNIRQIAPNVLSLIGLLVTLVFLHMGVAGAVLVQVAIQIFMTCWMVVRVHREAPLHLRWQGKLARGMLAFGRKSYVQTLAATLHLRIDQFMCAYFLSPAEVGLYAVAVNLGGLLDKIADAVGTVMFPRLAGLQDRAAHSATARVCRHTFFVLAVGVLALMLVAPEMPRVYGKDFAGMVWPLWVLLPGMLPSGLYQLLTRYFTSRARQEVNIAAACIAVVLNVALNWFMIPRYGIMGAAISNGISYGTAACVLLFAFIRESGVPVGEIMVPRSAEISGMVHTARGMVARLTGGRAA
jgi:O-antigen/teichoic acid export membrane protein